MCLLTPVSGEALIQAQIDAAKATSKKGSCDPISTVHVLAWSLVINLHRFFNVLLHAVYFFKWNWRVDHIASVFCRVARYAGSPLTFYENLCVGGFKVECHVEHLGQAASMLLLLGWKKSLVALLVQLAFRELLKRGQRPTPARPSGGEALPEEMQAKLLGMTIALDDAPLVPEECYKVPPSRVALLQTAPEGSELTNGNAVAVTCKAGDGAVVEMVVNSDTMQPCIYENQVMCTELSLTQLVEAQFEPQGPWTLSRGDLDQIEAEKAFLFARYQKYISMLQPDCLSTLRRMLQAGPINRLYSGGGQPPHVASHEGFALRMPRDEVQQWQMTNDKSQVQDIPRPVHALRVWDARARQYKPLDPYLTGAPRSDTELDTWFKDLVKTLKNSPWIGPELLDRLATSEKHTIDPVVGRPDEFCGTFSSRWSQLVVGTGVEG